MQVWVGENCLSWVWNKVWFQFVQRIQQPKAERLPIEYQERDDKIDLSCITTWAIEIRNLAEYLERDHIGKIGSRGRSNRTIVQSIKDSFFNPMTMIAIGICRNMARMQKGFSRKLLMFAQPKEKFNPIITLSFKPTAIVYLKHQSVRRNKGRGGLFYYWIHPRENFANGKNKENEQI